VESIRDTGSDTTFFMMQRIGDLYTSGGLYGCVLNADNASNYNSSDPSPSTSNEEYYCAANSNQSTTDVNDNWDRTELTEGVDDVGSGAGQNQLCSALSSPLPVDFARSSKPSAGVAGCNEIEAGYAKDGVPIIDYPIDPNVYGTSTSAAYSNINGGAVGPVANGWLPGDPTAGPYTGAALNNISNADNGGGATSTAYRLWCSNDQTATDAGARITDWGELTNLGPDLEVINVSTTNGSPTVTASSTFPATGSFPSTILNDDAVTGSDIPSSTTVSSGQGTGTLTLSNSATSTGTETLRFTTASTLAEGLGAPIGVPIRLMGVNTASGTEATMALFAGSTGTGNTGTNNCSSNVNPNDASDPNPATDSGDNASPHVALENDSDQLDQYAIGDWPSPDYVDQAIEVSTTLYFESNGVFNTNPYAAAATINGTSYSGNKVLENGFSTTTPNLLQNHYPTARTLFNIYSANTVRASTGGFINWLCDSNTNFSKGLDNTSGLNFDTELTTLIGTTYGFPRLTDATPAVATGTPPDNQPAPNNSCAASLTVSTTSGSDQITVASGSFPVDIVNSGGLVGGASVGVTGTGIPSGTTVSSGGGTNTLTLNNNATASGTVTVTFSGVPNVTSVANPQT
jgi:hypothetical protein